VLLGLLLLAYVKAQECVIEPADRVDCQKGDETTCVNSGCCWDPTWVKLLFFISLHLFL